MRIHYNKAAEAVKNFIGVEFSITDGNGMGFVILKDGENEAGRIRWDATGTCRFYVISEAEDPRGRRTGDLYKIADALREDLYLDDYFIIDIRAATDGSWSQWYGVKAVLEVIGGEPQLTDMRRIEHRLVEEYEVDDDGNGDMVVVDTIDIDEEISNTEFYKIVDEIVADHNEDNEILDSWYKLYNLEVLTAYREDRFNLKDFYDPRGYTQTGMDKYYPQHGGHWEDNITIHHNGWMLDTRDIPGNTDKDWLAYIKADPNTRIKDGEPIWVIHEDLFGVRRRVLAI